MAAPQAGSRTAPHAVSIQLRAPSNNKYGLIVVPKGARPFFREGYKGRFTLETPNITTEVWLTSAPNGTPIGARAGNYLVGSFQRIFRTHPNWKQGMWANFHRRGNVVVLEVTDRPAHRRAFAVPAPRAATPERSRPAHENGRPKRRDAAPRVRTTTRPARTLQRISFPFRAKSNQKYGLIVIRNEQRGFFREGYKVAFTLRTPKCTTKAWLTSAPEGTRRGTCAGNYLVGNIQRVLATNAHWKLGQWVNAVREPDGIFMDVGPKPKYLTPAGGRPAA